VVQIEAVWNQQCSGENGDFSLKTVDGMGKPELEQKLGKGAKVKEIIFIFEERED
jgi:hypothetical protein